MPTDTQQPHATEHPSDHPHSSAARLGAWAWLPVPVLLLAIIVTRVTDVRVAPTPSQVLFSIDVLTRMLPALVVIVMTALTFLRRGTPGVLLLGCGVAMWAATGYVNTFTLALGPNFGITVTNVGLGLAALCHLAGVLPSGARKVAARGLGLVTGYGLVLVAVGVLSWATWQGWLPRFFVEGQGGMPIRFFVLSAAMVMFVLSALLLSAKQQTTSSRFACWYTLALWLIALSVFGMLIQVSRDSLQNWMNRISQYLGSIYMLIAAITALRESGGAWLLPLEDALRESEERYHRLFNSMTEGFLLAELIRDADGTPIDFRILEANLAYESIFGCKREAAIGKTLFEVFPGLDIDRFAAIAQVAQTGEPLRWQGLFAPTGRFYECVYYSPRPGQLAGIFSDITARKQAEETLRRKDTELSEAQRIAHIGSWYWDAKTDVTTGSDELLRIYGFNPATQAMPNFTDQRGSCYPVEDWERINAAVQQTVETGVGYELDVQVIRNDTRIWVTTRGEGMWDGEGRIVGLCGTVQDITARKETEKALRESDERLQAIAINMPDHAVIQDRDLRYTFVINPQLGLSVEDHIGRTDLDILGPTKDAEMLTEIKQRVIESGKTENVLFPLVNMKGETEYFDGSYVPKFNDKGNVNGLIGYFRNITAEKRAEEALRESEERYKTLYDSLPLSTVVFQQVGSETILTEYNRASLAFTGDKIPEFAGKPIREIYPHHPDILALIERTFASHNTQELIKPYRKISTDEEIFLHLTLAYAPPDRVIMHSEDISAQKQAEEALRESEARYHSLFTSMHEGFILAEVITDEGGKPIDYRFLDLNPAAERYFGRSHAEIVGSTYRAIGGEHADTEWIAMLTTVALTGEPATLERYAPVGGQWVSLKAYSPRAGQFAAVFADISTRKQMEEAQLASLHEKEVLLKEIHHRVKNNMQVISSLVSLQADTVDDPVLRALFNDLRDQVRTMALVHEKLYQSESLANIDFAEYTQSLLSYLWRAYGDAAMAVRLTLDVQPVAISIEQAVPCGLLLNELVTNALKHAFRDRADGELTVALHTAPDRTVCLSVRDNGVGLPADWQHSPSLGLQLVQMLTRQVRGTLDVRTESGTAFALTFTPSTPPPHREG